MLANTPIPTRGSFYVEVSLLTNASFTIGLFQEVDKVDKSELHAKASLLSSKAPPTLDDLKAMFRNLESSESAVPAEQKSGAEEGSEISMSYSFSTGMVISFLG